MLPTRLAARHLVELVLPTAARLGEAQLPEGQVGAGQLLVELQHRVDGVAQLPLGPTHGVARHLHEPQTHGAEPRLPPGRTRGAVPHPDQTPTDPDLLPAETRADGERLAATNG
jgi:hypothetical protein